VTRLRLLLSGQDSLWPHGVGQTRGPAGIIAVYERPHLAGLVGPKQAAISACSSPHSRHGSARDRSPVTLWKPAIVHRLSCSSQGASDTRRGSRDGVCPAPLLWPARHTPHGSLIIPALCASTDGTGGRTHRRWGVCARTLRQRPAGQCLRKPGIASFVRPLFKGAYLIRHHVLLYPILRQEPHPLSYLHGILCQGFNDS
jgi:hypothetical protein